MGFFEVGTNRKNAAAGTGIQMLRDESQDNALWIESPQGLFSAAWLVYFMMLWMGMLPSTRGHGVSAVTGRGLAAAGEGERGSRGRRGRNQPLQASVPVGSVILLCGSIYCDG